MAVNKKWVGESKSDQFMGNKLGVPQVSLKMANGVSEYRRKVLSEEVDRGLFKDGSSNSSTFPYDGGLTSNSVVTSSVGIKKYAQAISSTGGAFHGAHGDTIKQAPEVYSPLWLNSNMNLPRDRATINAWCRAFFALNPFVHNAICLHSTYPISRLNIKCKNKDIEHFFNDMIEEIDLMNICVDIAKEYWLLGEAFIYAELDESSGKWSRLMIQNPDYMIVKRTVAADEPIIMLRPDENLKNIVMSNKPGDIEMRRQLNNHIIDSVKRGNNIPLDSYGISHLARKISPYEIRGTGLPVCIFRQLMLFDQLRESKYVQAGNMINPLTLVKIGSADYKPTHADIEAYREVFENAQFDKDFKVFTQNDLTVERVGYGQGIYDISGDITQIIKEIYVGLQVPSVLTEGGADTTYANGGVALDVLKQRYMQFRNMLSHWLRNKIFAPISKLHDFYDYTDGEKRLIIPDVDWNHMPLFDTDTYIRTMVDLTADPKNKRVSVQALHKCLGLEYDDEQLKIRKEAIQETINAKEAAALQEMDLDTLRTLDHEDEIREPEKEDGSKESGAEPPLPGETHGEPSPGSSSSGGSLPGLDLSPLPGPSTPSPSPSPSQSIAPAEPLAATTESPSLAAPAAPASK